MTHAIATHIEMRPDREGRDRAYVDGTRVRVQDVAALAERQGRTPDQIVAALPHLSLAQVHAALSYYFDHRTEIQRAWSEDADFAQQLRSLNGPGPLERRLRPTSGPPDDALPS